MSPAPSKNTTRLQDMKFLLTLTTGMVRAEPELTPRQLGTLLYCAAAPTPPSVIDIARHLDVAKPAITRTLDVLAEHKMTIRHTDEMDGRKIAVRLLPAGEAYVAGLFDVLQDARSAAR